MVTLSEPGLLDRLHDHPRGAEKPEREGARNRGDGDRGLGIRPERRLQKV